MRRRQMILIGVDQIERRSITFFIIIIFTVMFDVESWALSIYWLTRAKIGARKTPISSFYFDIHWLGNYWGCDNQPRK